MANQVRIEYDPYQQKASYGTEQLETQSGFPQKTLFLAAETGQILSINPGHK